MNAAALPRRPHLRIRHWLLAAALAVTAAIAGDYLLAVGDTETVAAAKPLDPA